MTGLIGASLIAAGVGSAVQLYNNWRQKKTAEENTDKTIQAQYNMQNREWQNNLDMWNKNNHYNSPVQQMARFKEAGLNPMLIYGKGTAGNATALPQYQAPKPEYNYEPMRMPEVNFLSQYMDLEQKQAQIDTQEQLAKNIAMKTITEGSKAKGQEIDNIIKQQLADYQSPFLQERNRNWKLRNETALTDGEIKKLELDLNRMFKPSMSKTKLDYEKIRLQRLKQKTELEKLGIGLPGWTPINMGGAAWNRLDMGGVLRRQIRNLRESIPTMRWR